MLLFEISTVKLPSSKMVVDLIEKVILRTLED